MDVTVVVGGGGTDVGMCALIHPDDADPPWPPPAHHGLPAAPESSHGPTIECPRSTHSVAAWTLQPFLLQKPHPTILLIRRSFRMPHVEGVAPCLLPSQNEEGI